MARVADESVGGNDDPEGSARVRWVGFGCTLLPGGSDAETTGKVMPSCAVSEKDLLVLHGIRLRLGLQVFLRFTTDPPMRRVLRGRVVQCRAVAAHVFAIVIRFTGTANGRRLVEIATGAAGAPTT